MTTDQFTQRSRMITQYFENMLNKRDELAWAGPKGLTNPKFRQVVAAQDRLLNAMEEMLDGAR